MSRWKPDAQGRLETAALELYSERGFDQTTVADIAARAGLTERTFFRHFADKREVLFSGQSQLQDFLARRIADETDLATPVHAIVAGLEAAAPEFPDHPENARRRRAVIAANAELQERELLKLASLTAVVTEALQRRGVGAAAARLAAELGALVFKIAFERWISGSSQKGFAAAIRETFEELRAVTGGV